MNEHAVVIAGGGPTGLMLAGELALAGVDVAIVERRATQNLAGRRAGGLHARTLEVLDQRGIADRFLSVGQVYPSVGFHMIRLDISDFPTRHNYTLGLTQNHIERLLAEWVGELEVRIYRGREVTAFSQDEGGVNVELADGGCLRAEYLAGCDGGRSGIRKAAGIEFAGWDPTKSWLIAEVEWTEEPAWGFRSDAVGTHAIGKVDDGRRAGIVLSERKLNTGREPTLRDVREALVAVYGTDYGIHNPTWISRFTDMTRQAAAYRDERVLLAGDAAHVHPPVGGQGLNIGVQDAMNLGWKLAQVVKRSSPKTLLDTYHAERHPVAARVLRTTMAQVALGRPDDRTKAVGDILTELLTMDEPRRRMAAEMSGLGVHYDLGEGHPLLGRRMPDLDVVTAGGPLRVFAMLHEARPVLFNFGAPGGFDIAPWADRVRLVDALYAGAWELPTLGVVPAPAAVLVRPDGYVAWVGDSTGPSLADALTTWFGPPAEGRVSASLRPHPACGRSSPIRCGDRRSSAVTSRS
jgi:3-(3-hydroxy-phenyl)propionate hydroxylase